MASAEYVVRGTPLGMLVVAAVSAFHVGAASAQPIEAAGPPMQGNVEFRVGLGAGYLPAYPGSDESKAWVLPLASARWKSGWFAGTTGVGFRVPSDGPWSFGVRATLDPGRDEDDAAALSGMGDIKARPEIGGFASYRLRPGLGLAGSFRYGSGNDRNGLLADASLFAMLPLGGLDDVVRQPHMGF